MALADIIQQELGNHRSAIRANGFKKLCNLEAQAAQGRELAEMVREIHSEAGEDPVSGCMSVDTHQLYECAAKACAILAKEAK